MDLSGTSGIELSSEQRQIVDHPVSFHARVLAGPGTGKSFTATLWLGELHRDAARALRSKMLTFTRAATAEFAGKLDEAGLADAVEAPATVHSHALSVLLGMRGHGLPEPLRIPDSWESGLIQRQQSRFLKAAGHANATPGVIQTLEREMAAGWETLDDGSAMLSDIDRDLRAAYVGTWSQHRQVFGYSLLAELPYRAGMALEDLGDDQPPKVDLLIVDEYQDLNAADIRFVAAHARLGVAVVAIGDDDQSIYGWRYADPAGIRRFCDEFVPSYEYTLTVSRRCGRVILDAASELIASAPGRAARPTLTCSDGAPEGLFAYVRFQNDRSEAHGAAAIVDARVRAGVNPGKILVLVRSQVARWRAALEPVFTVAGLTLANVDWVDVAMRDPSLRVLIALARLSEDPEDSLAWQSLTEGLTPGVGGTFTDFVYEHRGAGERWGSCLLRLCADGLPGLSPAMGNRVLATVRTVEQRLATLSEDLDAWGDVDPVRPWSGWLLTEAKNVDWRGGLPGDALSDDAQRLLELVGPAVAPERGLLGLLNQLEPLGKDLAAEEDGGVRLMSIAKSKGLTADTAVVMGVEEGLVPLGSNDLDEERRLLYVALTRAQRVCVATCAARRRGPLARSGGGRTQEQRRRSSLLEGLSFGRPSSGEDFVADLRRVQEA